jgi:hypothetical protein
MPDFEEKVKAAFDAEFDRTRPRPGLRQRVIANAVATPRVQRRGLGAWLTPPRFAAIGAAAALLLAVGIGFRVATQGPPVAIRPTPTATPLLLAFGKLPAPALHPPVGLGAGGGPQQRAIPYFGPATMTWSGQLPTVPSSAPVYRFAISTEADADAFATRLGAHLTSPGGGLEPRQYRGPGAYQLSVHLNDPVAGQPTYYINTPANPSPTRPFADDAARAAADAELARLGLTPSWTASVRVIRQPELAQVPLIVTVEYQHLLALGEGATAPEVDGNGDPSGIQVVMDTGAHIMSITGVLRLIEEPATYPMQPPSAVVNAAMSAAPLMTPKDTGPVPTVTMNQATLVYTAVVSGGVGYLEPAYLFTGTFTSHAETFEKRVLVPALAPRAIGSQ